MNPKYLVMFILLSAVVFSGGCTSQKSALPYSKYLAYENPSYGISMNYPSDWNVNEEAESIVVAFMSPSEDKNDRYRENVNVVMNDLSGQDMNLETYSSLATQHIMTALNGVEILEAADTTLDGNPARRLVYTANGTYGKLAFMQVFAIKNDISYIITYTSEADKASLYTNTAENMINSFRINPIPSEAQQNEIKTESGKQGTLSTDNVIGRWRAYSEAIFYDAGGSDYLDAASTIILGINSDGTWEFGSSGGTWKTESITDADWKKWATNAYGPTRKIVLNGWNDGVGDGPLEEGAARVDFIWLIYRNEKASLGPGQVQIKFGHTSS